MSKSKWIEYKLDGVIALPSDCYDAEEKMIKAIVALVEAMGGQVGGQVVHQLTAKDYKDMAIEAELWKGSNGAHRVNKRQRKASRAVAN